MKASNQKSYLISGLVVIALILVIIGVYDALTWASKSVVKGEVHKGAANWYLTNKPISLLDASIEGLPTELQREGITIECKVDNRTLNDGAFDYHLVVSECRKK